jgi:RNA polymerase sigma factor (sigma-70 family)
MVVHEYATWGRKWFRIRPSADPPQSAVSPSDQLDDRDVLRRELGALSRRQRAVLVLRYYAGLSDAEIAAELGCRETTVRSHASRALAALRIHMNQSESQSLEALA